MKTFLLPLAIGMALLFPAAPAFPAAQERIAAVVNDAVITTSDIRDRTRLYLSGGRDNVSPEQQKLMEQQVLNKLIDESLQIQEAKKLGITVREEDLSAGFADISRQNNVTPEEFRKRLAQAGASIDSLYAQIKADISWSQVVRRKLRPQVNISESEIDLTMSQIASSGGKAQYHVAEIFLGVPAPEKDNDIRSEAEKIIKQLTGGASFASVAREFSQAPGAANGGDLGWVQEGLLDPELDKALKQMQPGQISPPLRSAQGYHILFLRDLRQNPAAAPAQEAMDPADGGPLILLKQIIIPVTDKDPDAVINAKMVRGQSLKEEIKNCEDMDAQMKNFPAEGTGDLGKGPQAALPEALRAIVEKLPVNELSAPIRNPAGWAVLMVCAREDAPVAEEETAAVAPKFSIGQNKNQPSRETVANKIGLQRLDQMAERYLRDLRATAFIDKRI